jgi:DnaA family protein
MPVQLPLNLGLKDNALFASFIAAENAEAVAYLQNLQSRETTPCTYLWGRTGTGKSHLLQAVCHAAGTQNLAAVYLPLQKLTTDCFPPDVLSGLEDMAVICVDDIQEIAGHEEWEKALFGLLVRMDQNNSRLITTGKALPARLGFKLGDLLSRLNGGLIFHLQQADDAVMFEALLLRSRRRGMNLTPLVGRYLVKHFGKNMTVLFDALEKLDKASLVAKRKVTIPFIREVFSLITQQSK